MKNIIAFMCLLNLYISKAQNIVTDRPDQTESSSTIPQKSFQIESGFSISITESNKTIAIPSNLFRLALTTHLELRVFTQYETLKNQTTNIKFSTFNNLEVGAKIQLFKKDSVNTEVAFLSHLIIPTGSKNLTNTKYGTINKIAVSHQLNERLGIGYNLGYNYYGRYSGDFTYSLVLGYSLTDKVGLYLEPYGEWFDFQQHIVNGNTGLTYLLQDNFQIDFSFGAGINQTMNYFSLGFSWNISPKKLLKN